MAFKVISQIGESVDQIREFWDSQGEKFGSDLSATMYDPLAKQLELEQLRDVLDPRARTLEMGCGNGYNIFSLSAFLQSEIRGIDYSEKLVALAKSGLKDFEAADRVGFDVGNVLEDLTDFGSFPQIYTDRCLINLPSFDLQMKAVRNITEITEPGGKIIFIESTQQSQDNINRARLQVGLKPISYHWHNLYLDENRFVDEVSDIVDYVETRNFSSLYYLISRVFNAYLTPPDSNPDYLSEINKLSVRLPSVGDFGPLKLFHFRKGEAPKL